MRTLAWIKLRKPSMRAVGDFLIFLAVLAVLGALGMDTSVPVNPLADLLGKTSPRVHNIGLMHAQENGILLGVGLFISGVILFALGGKKSKASAETLNNESKKCPFCAEAIKKDAIVCRYCGRELPTERALTPASDKRVTDE